MGRSTNTLSRYMQMKGVPLPTQLAVQILTRRDSSEKVCLFTPGLSYNSVLCSLRK